MPKTMLIDATHPEETRVAVVDGNRLVEYDYESKVRKQLKGSVFLAKVTRVEPSLQAAFVNFGGNRHGFLPFSEIHPDYFRIPVADREALIAAQRAELEEHDNELEQAEAAFEQAAEHADDAEAAALCTLDQDDSEEEEDDLEPIVEVGGDDQPLLDDEEHDEQAEASAEQQPVETDTETVPEQEVTDESPKKRGRGRPRAAMSANEEVLRGPVPENDAPAYEAEEAPDSDLSGDDEEIAQEIHVESDEDGLSETEEGAQPQDGEQPREGDHRGRRRGRYGRGRFQGRQGRGGGRHNGRHSHADRDDQSVDTLGGDTAEGDRPFRFNLKRNYKIQEVIKRGQIMLIQVSKEERGNKGAAVTTYLSMPGRYCVLMPNSPRGGGVSRKIASFKDRKRMKDMLDDLNVPDGMSVILRTAGVTRTKVEIKRDLDYLTRLWNTIREHTLQSTAPALIYEEGSLIKRAIRDHYTRDIEDVHVSGDEGYKSAKEFMKMLMPSHAKKVQEYRNDRVPMFHKFGVENQIADIGEPTVNLKSGGYLVINPTEALVSVDVNSGRATKERHIEETALKTNLEAADEVARQLRLRDLGGLVVVDFIDMEDRRNNRKVEQRLRDALSTDRARIQVGRISSFGLLELSRQRMNPSLAEAQQEVCAHCAGTGRVKTLDFSAISIIRALEVEGIRNKGNDILLTLPSAVALYVLNNKRLLLADIENRYDFTVRFATDDTMSNSQYRLESVARLIQKAPEGIRTVATDDADFDEDIVETEEASDENGQEKRPEQRPRRDGEEGGDRNGRRRNRRGGRGRGDRNRAREDGDFRRDTHAPEGFEPNGNVLPADQDDIDDSIGNRAMSEELGDDSIGNQADGAERGQRGDRRGGRNRRGGRGRGRDRQRGDSANENVSLPDPSGLTQEQPRPAPAPRVEAVPHAAPPIQIVNAPRAEEPPQPRDYETVNAAPSAKKKGWWNKLIE